MIFNPGNLSGMSTAGAMTGGDLAELQKSLEADYGDTMSDLTGGGALRIQSLDMTLQATVQDNQHFVLFNNLPKPRATAVVDEWTEQPSIGGFFGGTFNTQDGAAMETNGVYNRRVGLVKFMSTYRKIPIVLERQNNIVDAVAIETMNGAKQLLTDIEVTLFEGDSTITPLAFDGIKAQIQSLGSPDHVIDLKGGPLNSIEPIARAAEVVFGYGNFGRATDIYLPPSVQTDLNQDLDPAFRVLLNPNAQNTVRGTSVSGVQTTYGEIKTRNDVFIRDERLKTLFQLRGPIQAAVAMSNLFKPAGVTAVAADDATTSFTTAQQGIYFYAVTAINQNGETMAVQPSGGAVTVGPGQNGTGQSVTITISPSSATPGAALETGYVIYRGSQNGPNSLGDLREMARVAYDPVKSPTQTVYVDRNTEIPGSTNAYVLNLGASDHAIAWRQYLPMMRIPMAAVNSPIIPWLQMICGYLRISKRNQHVLVKNIIPNGSAWKPFVAG